MSADINLQFSAAQAVFATDATVQSTNWLDFKVAQDLAGGREPVAEIVVTTSFSGGTSARFQLCAVDVAGANPEVLDTTDAIPVAQLTAVGAGVPGAGGTRLLLRMSAKRALPTSTKPYLRLQVVCVGAVAAGAISAHLVDEAGTQHPLKAYASGY